MSIQSLYMNVHSSFICNSPKEEKCVTKDEMVRYHHQLHGHKFEQILGNSKEQRNLACCIPWGCRVRQDLATEQQQKLEITQISISNE